MCLGARKFFVYCTTCCPGQSRPRTFKPKRPEVNVRNSGSCYELYILLTTIHLHFSLHFANTFFWHWNRLQVEPTFTSKDQALTQKSHKSSCSNRTSHIVEYFSTNNSPNKEKLQCNYESNWSFYSPWSPVYPFLPSSSSNHPSPFLVALSTALDLHFPPEPSEPTVAPLLSPFSTAKQHHEDHTTESAHTLWPDDQSMHNSCNPRASTLKLHSKLENESQIRLRTRVKPKGRLTNPEGHL